MEIGRVLEDRYEIVRPIADGASGTVWAARDRREGVEVAIKAVSLERAGWRAEVRDRFLQEARLLQLIRHDNLVGIRGADETDDGYLYLVLDLLEGETLAARLARAGALEWREAVDIARGVARGLGALHARGVVHRDLKPANVVLHRDPGGSRGVTPKLIDLGISKARAPGLDAQLQARLTSTGQVLGTPQYMSYEQALGERDIDARSDVWSLGVLLYEMLAGKTPFAARNVNAVLAAIRRGTLPELAPLAPSAPEELLSVVERCLRRDRADRYAGGDDLERALDQVLASARSGRFRASRQQLVLGGGAAILLVVGLLAWALADAGAGHETGDERALSGASVSARTLAAPVPVPVAPDRTEPLQADPGALGAEAAPGASAAPERGASSQTSPSRPLRPQPAQKRPVTRIDDAGF